MAIVNPIIDFVSAIIESRSCKFHISGAWKKKSFMIKVAMARSKPVWLFDMVSRPAMSIQAVTIIVATSNRITLPPIYGPNLFCHKTSIFGELLQVEQLMSRASIRTADPKNSLADNFYSNIFIRNY